MQFLPTFPTAAANGRTTPAQPERSAMPTDGGSSDRLAAWARAADAAQASEPGVREGSLGQSTSGRKCQGQPTSGPPGAATEQAAVTRWGPQGGSGRPAVRGGDRWVGAEGAHTGGEEDAHCPDAAFAAGVAVASPVTPSPQGAERIHYVPLAALGLLGSREPSPAAGTPVGTAVGTAVGTPVGTGSSPDNGARVAEATVRQAILVDGASAGSPFPEAAVPFDAGAGWVSGALARSTEAPLGGVQRVPSQVRSESGGPSAKARGSLGDAVASGTADAGTNGTADAVTNGKPSGSVTPLAASRLARPVVSGTPAPAPASAGWDPAPQGWPSVQSAPAARGAWGAQEPGSSQTAPQAQTGSARLAFTPAGGGPPMAFDISVDARSWGEPAPVVASGERSGGAPLSVAHASHQGGPVTLTPSVRPLASQVRSRPAAWFLSEDTAAAPGRLQPARPMAGAARAADPSRGVSASGEGGRSNTARSQSATPQPARQAAITAAAPRNAGFARLAGPPAAPATAQVARPLVPGTDASLGIGTTRQAGLEALASTGRRPAHAGDTQRDRAAGELAASGRAGGAMAQPATGRPGPLSWALRGPATWPPQQTLAPAASDLPAAQTTSSLPGRFTAPQREDAWSAGRDGDAQRAVVAGSDGDARRAVLAGRDGDAQRAVVAGSGGTAQPDAVAGRYAGPRTEAGRAASATPEGAAFAPLRRQEYPPTPGPSAGRDLGGAQRGRQATQAADPAPAGDGQRWWFNARETVARAGVGPQSEGERVGSADARPVGPARSGRPRSEGTEGGPSKRSIQGLTDELALQPSHLGTAERAAASAAGYAARPATAAAGGALAAALRAAGEARAALGRYTEAVAGQTAYWIRASLRASHRESVVTLDPPDLGRLRISLQQEGGQLTARIQAELPEVEALLREGGERIRERLDSQGLRIDALVIEAAPARVARGTAPAEQQHLPGHDRQGAQTAPQGGERHAQQSARGSGRGEGAAAPGQRAAARAVTATPAPPATPAPARAQRRAWAGLDVRA